MSEKTLKTRIRHAVKTESDWTSSNPVLMLGEIAYNSDNDKYKVGNGTSTWSQLSYKIPVTKSNIGLGNVENKSSATIRSELTKANVTNALGYTPPTTNTWRGIQNNLTSDSTTDSLSAAQGKVLKGLVDGKAASSHSHNYLPLSGGTVTGATQFNNYLKLNAWPGYGTGTANFWYDANNKFVEIQNATDLKLSGTKVSKDGHTHNYAGSTSAGGAANTAVKLSTARTIQTNLSSTSSASFDGSANITPGITGTLPIANGGTGKTTAKDAANNLINNLGVGDTAPTDDSSIIVQGVGAYSNQYYKKPSSLLWEYIKGKISSVLGLTAFSYGGNAATATKLTTSAGSATQPVYFSDGKPVACTYSLGKSVPSNAVFTDTKNTSGSTDTSSKIFLIGATSQAANPQTYSDNEVYATSGVLTTKSVRVGGGSVTLQYNSSTESLDFVFS